MSVNREDSDKTAQKKKSYLCLCFCRPFWQTTSVQNYRTFTVNIDQLAHVNIEHLAKDQTIMYIYSEEKV